MPLRTFVTKIKTTNKRNNTMSEKELIRKLFALTSEIKKIEEEIREFEKEKRFPPLGIQTEQISKMGKMYDICKEFFYE